VLDKIDEEIGELRAEITQNAPADRLEDELGDVLFTVANLARHLAIDPEAALRRATAKFDRRFRQVEALLAAEGKTIDGQDLAALEDMWRRVKAAAR
jgi:ATP diphosphatase